MKRFIITLVVACMAITTPIMAEEVMVEESGISMIFSGTGSIIDGIARCVGYPLVWLGEGMKKIMPRRVKRVQVPDVVVIDNGPEVIVEYPAPSLNNPVLTPETAPYYYQYLNYYNRQTPGYVPVPVYDRYDYPYYRGRPYGPPPPRHHGRPDGHRGPGGKPHHHGGKR